MEEKSMLMNLLEWCQLKGFDYPVDTETFQEVDRALAFSLKNDMLVGDDKMQAVEAHDDLKTLSSAFGISVTPR
jgi:hypothetical protein